MHRTTRVSDYGVRLESECSARRAFGLLMGRSRSPSPVRVALAAAPRQVDAHFDTP